MRICTAPVGLADDSEEKIFYGSKRREGSKGIRTDYIRVCKEEEERIEDKKSNQKKKEKKRRKRGRERKKDL